MIDFARGDRLDPRRRVSRRRPQAAALPADQAGTHGRPDDGRRSHARQQLTRVNNFPPAIRLMLGAVVEPRSTALPRRPVPGRAYRGAGGSADRCDHPILRAPGVRHHARTRDERRPSARARPRDRVDTERVIVGGGDTTDRPPDHPDDTRSTPPPRKRSSARCAPAVWMSGKNATDHVPLSAAFPLRLAATALPAPRTSSTPLPRTR